jgi:hypothetical protein
LSPVALSATGTEVRPTLLSRAHEVIERDKMIEGDLLMSDVLCVLMTRPITGSKKQRSLSGLRSS